MDKKENMERHERTIYVLTKDEGGRPVNKVSAWFQAGGNPWEATEQEQIMYAARVQALWNACQSISTSALEAGAVRELVEALRSALWVMETIEEAGDDYAENPFTMVGLARVYGAAREARAALSKLGQEE